MLKSRLSLTHFFLKLHKVRQNPKCSCSRTPSSERVTGRHTYNSKTNYILYKDQAKVTQECVLKSEVSCILHLKYKSVHACVQVMAIWTRTQSCTRNMWPLYPQIPLQGIHFTWETDLVISRSEKGSQPYNLNWALNRQAKTITRFLLSVNQ